MALSLRAALVRVGVIDDTKRGQPRKYFGEEGAKAKRALQASSQRKRRRVMKEAAERGEPPAILKRGRPRIYNSIEACKQAKAEQNRICMQRFRVKLEDGVKKLETLMARSNDSNDE